MSDKEQPAKKQKVKQQSDMGDFLDPSKCFRKNKRTGRIETFKVAAGSGGLVGDKHKCNHCEKTFKTANALGNHYNFCKLAIARRQEEEKKMAATGIGATVFGGSAAPTKQYLSRASASHSSSSQILDKVTTAPKKDNRKGNRGSSVRATYTPAEKLRHLEALEKWKAKQREAEKNDTVSQFCVEHHHNDQQKWNSLLSKWKREEPKIIQYVSEKTYADLKRIHPKKRSSPFKDMEDILYKEIVEHRSLKRKVSRLRINVRAKKILTEIDVKDGTTRSRPFRASNGWFAGFMKRKNIKFRARKSGKQKSADENWPSIKQWYGYLRHKVLTRHGNELCEHFSEKWGRFPPELRYNMDQVPLPFVVSMHHTYTSPDDNNVQIATTGKSDLRKRQFTMHIYVNAGEGEKRDGYVELICKGKTLFGTRFSKLEQAAWEVNMYFQKNAWMDTEVMGHSAQRFCDHVKQRWGSKKVLLFCDNLSAHVAEPTKQIYASGNVFLYFLPPSVTESLQAIDAGYGRSMRCAIGRLLDKWLLDEDNLALWEDEAGMVTGDRRVLMSRIVALANDEVLKNDKMRIGCFRRTGMLMTLDGSDDDMIRPQGLTIPVIVPQGADLTADDDDFNRIAEDEIDNRNGWDDDVDDDIREQDCGEDVDEEADVIVEAQLEGENSGDI